MHCAVALERLNFLKSNPCFGDIVPVHFGGAGIRYPNVAFRAGNMWRLGVLSPVGVYQFQQVLHCFAFGNVAQHAFLAPV